MQEASPVDHPKLASWGFKIL